jgi:peptidyl-tRNA hydrolase, PTH1 family
MKLIVGLGNPGREYDGTRHNAGFDVLDELARRWGAELRKSWRFPVKFAEVRAGGGKVGLAKPQTFMNRSGDAVAPLVRRKGVATGDLIVIVDDVDLELGRLRVRGKGSAGGHNGLKSLIDRLGTEEFTRVRVGVGRGPADRDMVGHVLGKFAPDERATAGDAIRRAADAVEFLLEQGVEPTMNRFNG